MKWAVRKGRPLSKAFTSCNRCLSSFLQKNESSGVNNSQVVLRVNAADIEGEPPYIPIRKHFLEWRDVAE
jgi:hypothetical protein